MPTLREVAFGNEPARDELYELMSIIIHARGIVAGSSDAGHEELRRRIDAVLIAEPKAKPYRGFVHGLYSGEWGFKNDHGIIFQTADDIDGYYWNQARASK